jgi:tetratricopeptide (TPR) repeat protein
MEDNAEVHFGNNARRGREEGGGENVQQQDCSRLPPPSTLPLNIPMSSVVASLEVVAEDRMGGDGDGDRDVSLDDADARARLLLLLVAEKLKEKEEYTRLKALGTDKFKKKQFEEAIKYYDQACAAIYLKIYAEEKERDKKEKKEEKDGSPVCTSTRLSCYVVCKNNATQCCINMSNFEGAIVYASEALSKDPKNAKALYRRGISYLALIQEDNALVDLQSSLELDLDP